MPLGNPSSCLHLSKGGRCSLWRWQPAREQCHQGCLSDISPWTGPSRSFAGVYEWCKRSGFFVLLCWCVLLDEFWKLFGFNGDDQGSSLSSDGQSCGNLRASVLPSHGGGSSGGWAVVMAMARRSNFDLLSFSIFFFKRVAQT